MSESSSESQNPEPKIIVDEDWKTQVEREKEELKQKEALESSQESASETSAESGPQDAASEPEDVSGNPAGDYPPPPEASLMVLASMLGTQALMAFGQLPDEAGNPMPQNLPYAKHFIDLLGILEEKTKGNIEPDEAKQLSDTLHQLRMFYISASAQK